MTSELDVSAVGKEFVRQYYTVLNQRPDCLHQFFTKDSSFVHGGYEQPGDEKPASRGQSLIHQKVMELGFHDCRTKILQVDCQKTVGNAVLVQVSGELSKRGEPMRRFMQSFVLVQQTPKNFYVHNDIFRYQDEVFVEVASSGGDASVDVVLSGGGGGGGSVSGGEVEEAPVPTRNDSGDGKCFGGEEVSSLSPEKTHLSEGTLEFQATSHRELHPAPIAAIVANQQVMEREEEVVTESQEVVDATITDFPDVPAKNEPFQQQQQPTQQTPPQQTPPQQASPASTGFSWASLASRKVPATTPNKPQAAIKPERKSEQQANNSINKTVPPNSFSNKTRVGGTGEEVGGTPRNILASQLFIGNLPHTASEDEVRELFERFGSVINVRICRKGTSNVPNYGFVMFDSAEAVTRALANMPITLHSRKINIEMKKDVAYRSRPHPRNAVRNNKEE